ncbi:hypothetical protein [Rhizobium sp. CECT 9324]|uniref:hypothetical protein n=1 Tax=Rhizobium sp. CECT 9324 TaxID=2845820 RepID=UPI001E613E85|nr:hypothetical protein [Rhizobium sp. CECT 9324]CAH0339613.1 hypothetical protein RHI9324_01264 [Rhizobium sp. CECT 9324]
MLNPYSEEERLQAMVSACYRASRSHFNHLAIAHVIDPPRDMFDAKLARQIAIHILSVEFIVPRRRLAALLSLARSTILGAVNTVDDRMYDPVFERAYGRIAARANDLFMAALTEAAGLEDAA